MSNPITTLIKRMANCLNHAPGQPALQAAALARAAQLVGETNSPAATPMAPAQKPACYSRWLAWALLGMRRLVVVFGRAVFGSARHAMAGATSRLEHAVDWHGRESKCRTCMLLLLMAVGLLIFNSAQADANLFRLQVAVIINNDNGGDLTTDQIKGLSKPFTNRIYEQLENSEYSQQYDMYGNYDLPFSWTPDNEYSIATNWNGPETIVSYGYKIRSAENALFANYAITYDAGCDGTQIPLGGNPLYTCTITYTYPAQGKVKVNITVTNSHGGTSGAYQFHPLFTSTDTSPAAVFKGDDGKTINMSNGTYALAAGVMPAGYSLSSKQCGSDTSTDSLTVTNTTDTTCTFNYVDTVAASTGTYWDGAGTTANSTVDGGDGNWTAAGTNWTNSGGTANGTWAGGTNIATFSGSNGGTVTVANGYTPSVGGMTFSKGYALEGSSITMVSPSANAAPDMAVAESTSTAISNVLTGTAGLSKSGKGSLLLKGANTYTGATSITAGILLAMNSSALGAGNNSVSVSSGASLGLSDSISISNTKSLSINGGGLGDLGALFNDAGSNTYGGGITLGADSTIKNATASTTLTLGTVSLGTNTLTVGGGSAVTVSGEISGTGKLTKADAGTLTLGATNTYTGATTVNAGTLALSGGKLANDTTVTVAAGATLDIGTATQTLNNALTISAGTTNGKLTCTSTANQSASLTLGADSSIASITGNCNIVVNSGKTLTLPVGISNTNLNIELKGGTLKLTGGQSYSFGTLTASANSTVDMDGSTTSFVSLTVNTLTIGTNKLTVSNWTQGSDHVFATAITPPGTTAVAKGKLNIAPLNQIPLGGNAATKTYWSGATATSNELLVGDPATLVYWDGQAATSNSVEGGTGDWTTDGTNWTNSDGSLNGTWPGDKAVAIFQATAGTASIATTDNFSMGGLTFKTTGYTVSGGSLTGADTTNVLTTDGTATAPVNVTISSALKGTNAFEKKGVGTLTLTSPNPYTGATTVSEGTLKLTNDTVDTNQQHTSGYSIASGATLEINTTAVLRFFNGPDNAGWALSFTGAGKIVKTGGSYVSFCGKTHTFALEAGSLIDIQAGIFYANCNQWAVWTNNFSDLNVEKDAKFDSDTTNPRVRRLTGAGTVAASYDPNNPTPTYANSGITVGAGADANTAEATFSGVVADGDTSTTAASKSFTKIGGGTQILSGTNTYKGLTAISAGKLIAANKDALGATTGTTTVASGASLGLSGGTNGITFAAEPLSLNGVGFGGANPVGALYNADGNNTFAGAITLAGNATISNNTTSSLSLSGTIATTTTGYALTFDDSGSLTVSNVISGKGTLTKTGAGTATLTGTNTYEGDTSISVGTVQLGAGGNTATTGSIVSNVAVADKALLKFSRSDAYTYGKVISGAGNVEQAGKGSTILTGANTYTGSTTVSAGTLQIGAGGTSATSGSIDSNSGTSVAQDALLKFNRSDAYSSSKVISGAGNVEQAGSGTTTLTAVNTYTGTTQVSAGKLALGSGGLLSENTTVTVDAAATLDLGSASQTLNKVLTVSAAATGNAHGKLNCSSTGANLTLKGGASTIASITGKCNITVSGASTSLALPIGINNTDVSITLVDGAKLILTKGQTYSLGALAITTSGSASTSTIDMGTGTTSSVELDVTSLSLNSNYLNVTGWVRNKDKFIATAFTSAAHDKINATPMNLITMGSYNSKYTVWLSSNNEITVWIEPRVTIAKVSNGGVGKFSFKLNGMNRVADTITTTVAGTPAKSANTSIGTSGTRATITEEAAPAGWSNIPVSASCIDSNASWDNNPATAIGTLSGNMLTIPAGNMVDGSDFVCTFTNQLNGLSGSVFNDGGAPASGTNTGTPNDGIRNGSEAGLGRLAVSLTDCSATTHATTQTDDAGNWSLNLPTSVAAGTTVCVVAAVPGNYVATGANAAGTAIPSGTATTVGGVTYTYTRSSQSMRFVAPGTGTLTMSFGAVPVSALVTDMAKSSTNLPDGKFVDYPHIFTPGSGGSVVFATTNVSNPNNTEWSSQIYTDATCSGSKQANATVIAAPVTVVQGQNYCIVVHVWVPVTGSAGNSNITTVTATMTMTNAAPALSASYTVKDTTTIGSGDLALVKNVRNVTTGGAWGSSNSAKSGDVLEYRIAYTNMSSAPMTAVVITDATPAYTKFVSANIGTTPTALGNCLKNTPANQTPAAAVSCSASQSAGGVGGILWNFDGTLQPGAAGNVLFQVNVE